MSELPTYHQALEAPVTLDSGGTIYSALGWIQHNPPDKDRSRRTSPDHGWKIHVSVHADDMAEAFDRVLRAAVLHGVTMKAAAPGMLEIQSGHPTQEGKAIVLYAPTDDRARDPGHWRRLAAAVEESLRASGIRPGPRIPGQPAVPGSAYMAYRNDRDGEGNYVAATDAGTSVPDGASDPFADAFPILQHPSADGGNRRRPGTSSA